MEKQHQKQQEEECHAQQDFGATSEEDLLQQALAMSMNCEGNIGSEPKSHKDLSTMTDEERIAYAMQISMLDGQTKEEFHHEGAKKEQTKNEKPQYIHEQPEVTSRQDNDDATGSLQKIFPDVSVEQLQHCLDADDGKLETASKFVLKSQHQIEDVQSEDTIMNKVFGPLVALIWRLYNELLQMFFKPEVSSKQDDDDATGSLQKIFPDASVKLLQRCLDAADGNLEFASKFVLESQHQFIEDAQSEPKVSSKQDDDDVTGALQKIFPDARVELLQRCLDAADGNPETASIFVLESQYQLENAQSLKMLRRVSGAHANTEVSNKSSQSSSVSGPSTIKTTKMLRRVSGAQANTEASNRSSQSSSVPGQSTIQTTALNLIFGDEVNEFKDAFEISIQATKEIFDFQEAITGKIHQAFPFIEAARIAKARAKSEDGITCTCCKRTILGRRYKCLICDDYDLCSYCEKYIYHTNHPMQRIPTPTSKFFGKGILKFNGEIIPYDQAFVHEGVKCDGCSGFVLGFRYKCAECDDFDLCHTCEHTGEHPHHIMKRITPHISAINVKLRTAVWEDNSVGVSTALREGAKPNFCLSATENDWWGGQRFKRYPILTLACANGLEKVVDLLLRSKANVELRGDHIVTPLHRSALSGYPSIVRKLIQHGAQVNSTDSKNGLHAIHYAAIFDHVKVAKVLKECGCDLESIDYFGNSPLHKAAFYGKKIISKWLVEEGVIVTSLNHEDKTPSDVAKSRGHVDLASFLQKCRTSPGATQAQGDVPAGNDLNIQDSDTRDVNKRGVQIIFNGVTLS